jgi:N-acetylneuraminate synthase
VERSFDFRNLFVLDLANNHQGSLEHGRRVIREVADAVDRSGVRAALKFQFRQLDSFIHPAHQEGSPLKYVQRFLSTRLKHDEFRLMVEDVRERGMVAMCTPFDEESVDVIVRMGFEAIKVASCSARDWPLLEKVADAGKPVIASTGGLATEDIDNLVSFFQHRGVDFALMHCVSIYPTPDANMNLAQIRAIKERHPGVCVGWSTHERPEDLVPVGLAVAYGADLFERHVGVATDKVKLNDYSSTPAQLEAWFAAWKRAVVLCGPQKRPPASAEETVGLDSLRRGVYAKRAIRRGAEIAREHVFFAMPYEEGQLASGQWKPGVVALADVAADAPVPAAAVELPHDPDVQVIKGAIHEVKAMLNEARIHLGTDFKVEYSHHKGIENFRKTGAVIIECINREYCKKLVIQLPGQQHPSHFHKRKEETFQILWGKLYSKIDDRVRELYPGDTVLVQPGVWHSFWTDIGVIFEEVSTTHYNDDSFYEDKTINKMQRSERKTVVDNWGRFQLPDRGERRSGPPEQ